MSSDNQMGDKIRLYGLITACLVILLIAVWVSVSNDDSSSPMGENDSAVELATADTSDASQDAAVPAIIIPTFDVVRISRGGTGVIAGRAAPGSTVELYSNDVLIATVIAEESGDWVAFLSTPLSPGTAELNLMARSINGNSVNEADKVVIVSVPERDEDIFIERKESGVVAVLSSKDGKGPSKVMQRPASGFREIGDSLSFSTIDYTTGADGTAGEAIVIGQALPRVTVRLYMDDVFIGSMKASDESRWEISIPQEKLTQGPHILRADQTVSEGSVQLRIEQPFDMGQAIDPSKSEGGVIVKPGNTLWQIARLLYGSGVQYTLIFIENSDQIRDPDKIYPGQIFALPKKEN